jgi:precorrin-6B methylase 2
MDFQIGKQILETLYKDVNGYAISTRARRKICNADKAHTYGEVVPESFYQMMVRVSPIKGEVFYDLGSGTGKAVILASLFFEFSKCIGIETLEDLHKASRQVLENYQHYAVVQREKRFIDFINTNFLEYDISDGDIFFIHATCFPDELMSQLGKRLEFAKTGARVITVTKTFESDKFQSVDHHEYQMSWGKATIYFYKKI